MPKRNRIIRIHNSCPLSCNHSLIQYDLVKSLPLHSCNCKLFLPISKEFKASLNNQKTRIPAIYDTTLLLVRIHLAANDNVYSLHLRFRSSLVPHSPLEMKPLVVFLCLFLVSSLNFEDNFLLKKSRQLGRYHD